MSQTARRQASDDDRGPQLKVLKPAKSKRYSGLTTVRCTPELHERFAAAAAEAGQTLNDRFVEAMTASLEPGKATNEQLERALAERDEARKALDRERKLRLKVQAAGEEVTVDRVMVLLEDVAALAAWGVEAGADPSAAVLKVEDASSAEALQAAWRRAAAEAPLFANTNTNQNKGGN